MSLTEKITKLHLDQNYGEDKIAFSFDDLRKKFINHPNESAYVIECRTARLEPLSSNFYDIIGGSPDQSHDLAPLYEHIHKDFLEDMENFTCSILATCFNNRKLVFKPLNEWFTCLYKNKKGRWILKGTGMIQSTSTRIPLYTIGKITDLTGLVNNQKFQCKFEGTYAKKFYANYLGQKEMEPLLSSRELKILAKIGKGMSSIQIATELNISRLTVDTHRKNIIRKLETKGSIQAYNKARDLGLFKTGY